MNRVSLVALSLMVGVPASLCATHEPEQRELTSSAHCEGILAATPPRRKS